MFPLFWHLWLCIFSKTYASPGFERFTLQVPLHPAATCWNHWKTDQNRSRGEDDIRSPAPRVAMVIGRHQRSCHVSKRCSDLAVLEVGMGEALKEHNATSFCCFSLLVLLVLLLLLFLLLLLLIVRPLLFLLLPSYCSSSSFSSSYYYYFSSSSSASSSSYFSFSSYSYYSASSSSASSSYYSSSCSCYCSSCSCCCCCSRQQASSRETQEAIEARKAQSRKNTTATVEF